jgi:hypothetical protein
MIDDRDPPRSRAQLMTFGLAWGAVFGLVLGVLLPLLRDRPLPTWPWIVACAAWAVAVIVPHWLRPLHAASTKLGHVVALIETRVLLALTFFLVVMPVGLVMRVARKRRTIDRNATTYRVLTPPRTRESMERPF